MNPKFYDDTPWPLEMSREEFILLAMETCERGITTLNDDSMDLVCDLFEPGNPLMKGKTT